MENEQSKFVDFLKEHIGEMVFVVCAEFTYRGILGEVGPSHIFMTNSMVVLDEYGRNEDKIQFDIRIENNTIELVSIASPPTVNNFIRSTLRVLASLTS